jgi:hypothetical protein
MPELLLPLARQRVAQGHLPGRLPRKSYGGPSRGGTCGLCSEPIARGSMEMEAEGDYPAVLFHPTCYAAWNTAIRQAQTLSERV